VSGARRGGALAGILILLVLQACGGDSNGETSESGTQTDAERPLTLEEVEAALAGKPCHKFQDTDLKQLPPTVDCNPRGLAIIVEGDECQTIGGASSGLADNLYCDEATAKWTTPERLKNPPGPQPGEVCVPGEPLPPGLVCK
jgi:hypothetical protein